jgi:hypothetical protein
MSKSRELQIPSLQWQSKSFGLVHPFVSHVLNLVLQHAVHRSEYLGQQQQVLHQTATSSSALRNTIPARKSLVTGNAGMGFFKIPSLLGATQFHGELNTAQVSKYP